jgi:hypothetical protein
MADAPRFRNTPLSYRVEIRRTDDPPGRGKSIVLEVTTDVRLEDILGDYSEQTGAQFG